MLAYWKAIAVGIVVILIAGLSWHVKGVFDAQALEKALTAQKTAITAECDADKKLTTEASKSYEKSISDLNGRVAALKLRPSRCIAVAARPAAGTHAGASGNANGPKAGVDSTALYDFAGECETYRLRLVGLQDFVTKVWTKTAPGQMPAPAK